MKDSCLVLQYFNDEFKTMHFMQKHKNKHEQTNKRTKEKTTYYCDLHVHGNERSLFYSLFLYRDIWRRFQD